MSNTLKNAVRTGNIEAVRQLLQNGEDPNHFDFANNTSPLSLACVSGQPDIVKLLLEKLVSAPEHLKKNIYKSSLEKVVSSSHKQSVKVAEVLLCLPESESSSEPESESSSEESAKLQFLNRIWSNPAIANIVVDLAITKGNDAELVRLVLQRFKVTQDTIAFYLSYVCTKNADRDLVPVLLENVSRHDINSLLDQDGWSLLMKASARGHNKVVEVLLENGANIDFQDKMKGNTALMVAVQEGKAETVKLLLEKGAAVDVVNKQGKTALLTNTLKRSQGQHDNYSNVEIIRALLAKNADVNKQDDSGRTALVNAVQNKSVGAVKLLLDNRAKTNMFVNNYMPLLNYAIKQSLLNSFLHGILHDNDIPKLLLQHSAPVNLQDSKREESPLIVASRTMNAEMCRLLLDKGAKVNIFDRDGACALLHAVRQADPNQHSHLSPTHILRDPAVKEMKLKIIEMLLKHDEEDTLNTHDNYESTAADILRKIPTSTLGNIENFPELKKLVTGQADVPSSDEKAAEQTPSSLPPPALNQPPQTSAAPSTSAGSSEQAETPSSLPLPELHPHTLTGPDPPPDPTSTASTEQPPANTPSSLPAPELAQASQDNEATTTASANTSTAGLPVPAWQRKFNVVLYGVSESKGTSRQEREGDDLQSAHSIVSKISSAISLDSIRDCTRMGKYSPDKTRPLLVKMVREREARLILHSLKDLTPGDLEGVAVKRHMSPTERQAECILLKERWTLAQSGLDKEHLKIRGNKLLQDSAPIGEVVGGVYKQIPTSN